QCNFAHVTEEADGIAKAHPWAGGRGLPISIYVFEDFLGRIQVALHQGYLTEIDFGIRLGTGIAATTAHSRALFIESTCAFEISEFGIKPAERVQQAVVNGFVAYLF